MFFFFFKQKTAYEMRISDWSSDVCSSDLAGCVSGPDFERPDAPSATAYRSPSDPAGTPAPGPAAQAGQGPALRWWTAFGSAALDALVARAIANNYSLAASHATLRASTEEVNAAAGTRLPQGGATARVDAAQARKSGG